MKPSDALQPEPQPTAASMRRQQWMLELVALQAETTKFENGVPSNILDWAERLYQKAWYAGKADGYNSGYRAGVADMTPPPRQP